MSKLKDKFKKSAEKIADFIEETAEKVEKFFDQTHDDVQDEVDFVTSHPEIYDALKCVTVNLKKAAEEKNMDYYTQAHDECFVLHHSSTPTNEDL